MVIAAWWENLSSKSSKEFKFIASATSLLKFLKLRSNEVQHYHNGKVPSGNFRPWMGDVQVGHGLGNQLFIQMDLALGLKPTTRTVE